MRASRSEAAQHTAAENVCTAVWPRYSQMPASGCPNTASDCSPSGSSGVEQRLGARPHQTFIEEALGHREDRRTVDVVAAPAA